MGIPDGWRIERRTVEVVHLVNPDGVTIQDTAGQPYDYGSVEAAEYAARNWQPMPSYDELRSMSDDEIHGKIADVSRWESFRRALSGR